MLKRINEWLHEPTQPTVSDTHPRVYAAVRRDPYTYTTTAVSFP